MFWCSSLGKAGCNVECWYGNHKATVDVVKILCSYLYANIICACGRKHNGIGEHFACHQNPLLK